MKVFVAPLLLFLLLGCAEPQARKPISHSRTSKIKASAARNIAINKQQEKQIQKAIRIDTLRVYKADASGFWYALDRTLPLNKKIETGDEIEFLYRIQSLEGEVIYDEMELGKVNYLVDKEDLLPALRQAVKKLREKEIGVFLMPSFLAYGYQGDMDKVDINQPLRFTIEIKKVNKHNSPIKSE